jgi:hypothetical protein
LTAEEMFGEPTSSAPVQLNEFSSTAGYRPKGARS